MGIYIFLVNNPQCLLQAVSEVAVEFATKVAEAAMKKEASS